MAPVATTRSSTTRLDSRSSVGLGAAGSLAAGTDTPKSDAASPIAADAPPSGHQNGYHRDIRSELGRAMVKTVVDALVGVPDDGAHAA